MDHPQLSPDDIVIAVVGVTGAGKTTFIQYFIDQDIGVGHGLESCTVDIQIWPCRMPDGTQIYLVDTPGFDDTKKSDSDILKLIAYWLNESYKNQIKLSGLIYLHRVSDIRVGGSAAKNLRMFKNLCGDNGLGSVVLATTMWQNPQEDARRENELCEKFWKYMIGKGSQVFRQDRAQESAKEIILYLINKSRPVTLDIQDDMVNKHLTLDQTAAGKELRTEVEEMRKMYEKQLNDVQMEMKAALEAKDRDYHRELANTRRELQAKIAKGEEDIKNMALGNEELKHELEMRFNEQLQEEKTQRAISDTRHKLELDILGLKHELQREKEREKERQDREAAIARVREEERLCIVM